VLNIVGLPEIRRWFVGRLAAKRLMPAAHALHHFLVTEGQKFLPNLGKSRTSRRMRPKVPALRAGAEG
jgi:hypothetical protein